MFEYNLLWELKGDLAVDPNAILLFETAGAAECLPAVSFEPKNTE